MACAPKAGGGLPAVRWIATGELIILLATSPLFLFFRPAAAPILLLLPALWSIHYLCLRHWIPRTAVDWPILGIMVMALVSLLVTPDLVFSLNKVVGLVYSIAVFYALVRWGQRRQSALAVAVSVAALGGATALLALLGTQWGIKWSLLRGITLDLPRLISALPGAASGFNPNTVSGTLITFVPLQACLLWGFVSEPRTSAGRAAYSPWLSLAVAASLLLTMLVILFAQSRAAWAALIVGLICLLLAIGAQRVGACRLCRSRWLRVVAALVVFGLVVSLIVLGVLGANGLLERNVDVPGRDNPVIMDGDVWLRFGDWLVQRGWMTRPATMSWAARVEVWSRALWASAEFPLTGLGMDMFRRSAWEMYPFFQMAYGQDFGHAHNILLQVALDLGLPGLISYLALLVGLLVAGWWSYRSSTNQFTRLITLGGIVGLATHALWSFVDALPLGARTNVHWWAMAALLATTSNLVLSKGVADSAKAGAEATSVAASRT